MPQDTAPRLSHVGLYVHDVPKMINFYSNVLGFVVSDGAEDGRITFLSRNPSDHHQVVLVRGRTTDAEVPMVQQVSFNVGTLAQVQTAFITAGQSITPSNTVGGLEFDPRGAGSTVLTATIPNFTSLPATGVTINVTP